MKVFICYSHRDAEWRERLRVHLKPLGRAQLIEIWDDTMIEPGSRWIEDIERELASTKIAVLLVSADFFASDFIVGEELPRLLNAAAEGRIVILPVILSPSMIDRHPDLARFQTVNNSSRPLKGLEWVVQEEVLHRVYKRIEAVLGRAPEAAAVDRRSRRMTVGGIDMAMPVPLRYLLDRCCPKLHTFLTTKAGLFKEPPDLLTLRGELNRLSEKFQKDIFNKVYVEPRVKDVPEDAQRLKIKLKGAFTPLQQMIKVISGAYSGGGDSQNAQIAAISRKSKFVRSIIKLLLKAREPLILLGDPGMGKTITLQQAAGLIAARESKRVFPTLCLFINLGGFRLPDKGVGRGAPVNRRWGSEEQAVWDYVCESAPPEVRPHLDGLAAKGRLVIFFDGMDEMNRARYNDYTHALSLFAGNRTWQIKTLFSCRITDFTPTFRHKRLVLLPFTADHIFQYLKLQEMYAVTIDGELWTAKQLAKRIAENTLPVEATIPFVLRLLCEYIQKEQKWPGSRVELLDYYNRSNYERKMKDEARGGDPAPPVESAFLTWGRIAYEITERNVGAEIPLYDVKQLLAPEELPLLDAGKICGILHESDNTEPPVIQFEHHRFQEFFTAHYLDEHGATVPAVRWLEKLDAPRWQETLFNLVLMGGGDAALTALDEAIADGLENLKGSKESQDTASARTGGRAESLLADRVELASRILQQTGRQVLKARAGLLATFQHAVYWLAEHGNEITKVKMLLAARAVPESDIWGVVQKVRESKVAWVRRQVRVISWATDREVKASELQDKDPTVTLKGYLSDSFASGLLMARLGNYVRDGKSARQGRRFWLTLAFGLILSLGQFATACGLVTAADTTVMPAYTATAEWLDKTLRRVTNVVKRKRERVLEEIDKTREQLRPVTHEDMRIRGLWWFLPTGYVVMFLALLYALRYKQGEQYFVALFVGSLWLLLPLALPTFRLGVGGNYLLLFIFGFLFVPAALVAGWVLLLLAHGLTLALFHASTSGWTEQKIRVRPQVEAMWENAGFRSWGREAKEALYLLTFASTLYLIAALTEIERARWEEYFALWSQQLSSIQPSVLILSKLIVFGLSFVALLTCVTRVAPWALQKDWRQDVRERLEGLKTWQQTVISKPDNIFETLTGCLGYIVLGLIGWGLYSIRWHALWEYVLNVFGLFPALPRAVNASISALVYAEAAGFIAALTCTLIYRREGWRQALKGLLGWTVVCASAALVVLLAWGVYSFDKLAAGRYILNMFGESVALTLNLLPFHFIPSVVNRLLSLAVYVETVGCLLGLVIWVGKKDGVWAQARKVMKRATIAALSLAGITLAGWGLVALIRWLGWGVRLMRVSGWLEEIVFVFFAVLFVVVAAMALLIVFTRQIRKMRPGVESLFRQAGTAAEWKQQFSNLGPRYQARCLREAKPGMFGLSDEDLLSLLEEIEASIVKEPALSTYWEKRYEIESIARQHRVG